MRILITILLSAAVALGAFAWWGMFTAGGRRRFDEMDGLYPFFAGVAAGVLALVAAVLWVVRLMSGRGGS